MLIATFRLSVKYIGGGNEMHCVDAFHFRHQFIFGTNMDSLSCVTLLVYPNGNKYV